MIRKIIADSGAKVDFISEVHPNVVIIAILSNSEATVLDNLRNDLFVESIFEDTQYQTF